MVEASARTFRHARMGGLPNPCNVSEADLTTSFVREVVLNSTVAGANNSQSSLNLDNVAGRYPGSWTLPVCDTSTWGGKWNWDYTKKGVEFQDSHPPCLCGKGSRDCFSEDVVGN